MSENTAEKRGLRQRLNEAGESADSILKIAGVAALVLAVAGSLGITGWVRGWFSSGDGKPVKPLASIRLEQRTPKLQDDQADTYTLVLRFQGHGKTPCTIRWQRIDAANSLIDPVPRAVACAHSGAFEQDVRIPVPDVSGSSYRVTFQLAQDDQVFGSDTTNPQFVP